MGDGCCFCSFIPHCAERYCRTRIVRSVSVLRFVRGRDTRQARRSHPWPLGGTRHRSSGLGRFPGVTRLGSAGAFGGQAAVFYPLAASFIGLRWPLERPGSLYSALSLLLGAVYPLLLRSLGNAPRRELTAITTGAVLTVGWLNFCFRHAWLKTGISPVECLFVGETVALCAVVWKWLSSRRRLSAPYNLAALGASVAVLWLYPAWFGWRAFASLFDGPALRPRLYRIPLMPSRPRMPKVWTLPERPPDHHLDTLRADALSLYDERNQTPHIDQLGREGVVFEQAQVQAPFTLASMVSMFSGWYPEALKTAANTYYIPDHHTLLAKKLARKGYRTASIVANPILSPSIGIQQGFADVTIVREDNALPNTSRYVTDLAIRFLQDTSARPFLLWVHYYDPHAPYDPPAEYRTLAYEGPLPARVAEFTKRGMYLPPSDLEYVKSLYLGDVRFVMDEVGRLLEALRTRESYDKTVIVLTSDHGEEHYDHGGMWHGHTMYQELLRVPLILKGPSLPQSEARARPRRADRPDANLGRAPRPGASGGSDPSRCGPVHWCTPRKSSVAR